ncbi:hypothetical protein [Lacticaseibacillus yichunensis]|uniref:hypothetical protein n=1 Tax=Lacticaseibacillus yichunensis TaxID=2486015 RepID=UPI0013DE4928|nr:hypothetical protein [Lacticaseibacillus yichunensis]
MVEKRGQKTTGVVDFRDKTSEFANQKLQCHNCKNGHAEKRLRRNRELQTRYFDDYSKKESTHPKPQNRALYQFLKTGYEGGAGQKWLSPLVGVSGCAAYTESEL